MMYNPLCTLVDVTYELIDDGRRKRWKRSIEIIHDRVASATGIHATFCDDTTVVLRLAKESGTEWPARSTALSPIETSFADKFLQLLKRDNIDIEAADTELASAFPSFGTCRFANAGLSCFAMLM